MYVRKFLEISKIVFTKLNKLFGRVLFYNVVLTRETKDFPESSGQIFYHRTK